MKRFKKILAICLAFAMLLSLAACKDDAKEPEQGKINEVEIKDDIPNVQESGYQPFTELDDDLDYEYIEVKSDYLQLRFNVPSTWTVSNVNAGALKLQAPDNDPYMPGYTCYLLSRFQFMGLEQLLPFQFESFFEGIMPGFYYNIAGKEYREMYNDVAADVYSNTDFTEETEKFSFIEYKNVYVEDKNGMSSRDTAIDALHYNIDWTQDNQSEMEMCEALSLKSLVLQEHSEGAKKVLTHIVSSFKGHTPSKYETKEITMNGVTIALPQDFEQFGDNLYKADPKKDSEFAGIQVGVFELDLNLSNFNGMEYAQTKAPVYANAFMPGYNNVPSFPAEAPMEIVIGGKTATFIYGTVTHIGNPSNNYAADFYGQDLSATMMVYDLGGKQIVIWTPDAQMLKAVSISDLVIAKTNF